MATPTRRRRLFALALAPLLIVVAVLLGIAGELFVRLASEGSLRLEPTVFIPDSELIYRLNPDHPDSLGGFRGGLEEGNADAEPNTSAGADLLIVCMGGSTTYGHGVEVEQAWPAFLSEALAERDIRARVLNAAVPGHGAGQHLTRYPREIAPLHPDLVVIYAGWNRTGAAFDPEEWVPPGLPRPEDGMLETLLKASGQHSLLVRKVAHRIYSRKLAAADPQWAPDSFRADYREQLERLVRMISEDGAEVALVVYPTFLYPGISDSEIEVYQGKFFNGRAYDPRMPEDIQSKHAAIRETARATGAWLVDVSSELATIHGEARQRLFLDELHLSAEGNRVTGAAIAEALAPRIEAEISRAR